MNDEEQDPFPIKGVDLSKPSVARVYDWYLGGKANWAIDRQFGERVLDTFPLLRPIAIANRLFLHRVVRYLARHGIRQFIDVGSGVPTMGNTHAVADEVAPDSRVVYVDNDPVAVAHSQTLLEAHGDPDRHAAINADLRNPERLWQRAIETGVLDFDEPIALMFIAVLHVKQPNDDGEDLTTRVLARYRELLPPGSYLALSHITDEDVPPETYQNLVDLKAMYDKSNGPMDWRSKDQIRELFGDFELVEPGMSWTIDWHPEDSSPNSPKIKFSEPSEAVGWVGVARKP